MTADRVKTMREVCLLIVQDMEADVLRMDGRPLNGALVAEMHGNLAAAISALAVMVANISERPDERADPLESVAQPGHSPLP
jgi:hypothetical protein